MYICIYVHTYDYISIYTYIHMYIYIYTYLPDISSPSEPNLHVSFGDVNAISLGKAREGCKADSGAEKKGQSWEKIGFSRDICGIYYDFFMVIFMGFSVI